MAEHTLSILVKALGTAKAAKDLKGVDAAISNLGSRAGQGIKTAGANIAKIGAVAAGGIAIAVKTGLDDLALLEDAVSSVDGAITQMGLAGKVTGAQVADWANQIERDIGAAFDDKDITQATTTLIRFGKVTPENLRPAMQVITDLATKTGDVESAASLLAKALADPEKAAGKLARTGVVLTKQQQDQIKAMVEAGDTAGAQALLLDALAESTEGAAKASQGPYRRAMSTLADVSEDARKALAEGFLPVIEKVADMLSSELAKPQTMKNIREFGNTLAGGLDSLIGVAKNLPWATIGDSLRIGGQGAKAVLDAFVNLPPWIQTAVITGWGLNKLTGGALGGIAAELGKGLIKGVLGMNAGVVNARAGVVNVVGGAGAGGIVGTAGKAGKVGGVAGAAAGFGSAVMKVFMVGAAAGIAAELWGQFQQQGGEIKQQSEALTKQTVEFADKASIEDMKKSLTGIQDYQKQLINGLDPQSWAYALNIHGAADTVKDQIEILEDAIRTEQNKINTTITTAEIKTHTGLSTLNDTAKSQLRGLFDNTGVTRTTADYVADQIKRDADAVRAGTSAANQNATRAWAAVTGTTNTVQRAVQGISGLAGLSQRSLTALGTVAAVSATVKGAVDSAKTTIATATGAVKGAVDRKSFSATVNIANKIPIYVDGQKVWTAASGWSVFVKPGVQGNIQEFG